MKKGDVVAIWGAGPIGQMCADMAFINGAERVIMVDCNWRLDYVKKHQPRVELVNFNELPKGTDVPTRLKEMVHGGPDVALECVAGEYAKSWTHYAEMLTGLETDTSEILNELIMSVKSYGRVGVTGIYVGYVSQCLFFTSASLVRILKNPLVAEQADRPTISTLAPSWREASASSVTAKRPYICTGRNC